ncbi:MAG: hypothetical protein NXH85_10175 [Pseudomonadaceae bacterium]|nr:hypothetical protein [Pseudomonadaceae bacterium]
MKHMIWAICLGLISVPVLANERAEKLLTELQDDPTVQWLEADDWTVANRALEQWLFTREGHPAHLSVAHRQVVEENETISIKTNLICGHDEPTCKTLLAEIELIDGEIKDAVTASPPTRTIEHPAYLLHVQTNQDWELVRSEFNVVAVRRSYQGGMHSNVGSVQIYNLPEFASDEAFLAHVTKQRRKGFENDVRTDVIEMREMVESFGGATCIRLDYHYRDLESRMDDGTIIDLPFRDLGYRCRHPSEPRLGVHLSYSLRAPDVDDNEAFNEEAMRFLSGIEFLAFELD